MIKIRNRAQLHTVTAILVGEQANEPENIHMSQRDDESVQLSVCDEFGYVERATVIDVDGSFSARNVPR